MMKQIEMELFCRHEWKEVNKEEYSNNYVFLCNKCGKVK